MDYKVVITIDAEADLDQFVWYLLFEKKSEQAAKNLLEDFEVTKKNLERTTSSFMGYLKGKSTLMIYPYL